MSRTTDLRLALEAALEDLDPAPENVRAALGPSDYDRTRGRGYDALKFFVRVVAGSESPATVELLDRYLDPDGADSVKEAIETYAPLSELADDIFVSKTSGHQSLAESKVGATWEVSVSPKEGD